MRTLLALSLAASTAALSLTGCSAAPSEDEADELELAESEDGLSSASNFGYVALRRDYRKCMFPMCGGYFARRVNLDKTRCADGTLQEECYVATLSLKGMKLSQREEDELASAAASGKALLKVRAYKTKINGGTWGTLKASEGWIGATGSTPDGTFYRAYDNGIRCVRAPCPTTSVAPLNGGETSNLVDVILDQTATPASAELLDRASQSLASSDGLLFAGSLLFPKCRPSATTCGPKAIASEFYVRVTAREGKACGARGVASCNPGQFCSWAAGDLCGAADAPGTCAYRPEACIALYKPVCGCDDKTYGNSCEAASAGVGVLSEGACVSP
jgi:hypothetical protein